MVQPKVLAMLCTQGIAGDDALLRLARERFREAGVGGEFYPNGRNFPCHRQLRRLSDKC